MRSLDATLPHRATSERMLDGGPDGPPSLAALLAAARAPGTARELDREAEALAAFRAAVGAVAVGRASVGRAGRAVRTHARRPAGRRLVSLRIAAIAAAAIGLGGVAVAATTGAIPLRLNPHGGPSSTIAPSPGGPSGPAPSRPPGPSGAPGASRSPGDGTPAASPADVALVGLCRAYREIAGNTTKALDTPPFAPLVAAAGGESGVEAYCARILGDPMPSAAPTSTPSAPPSHGSKTGSGKRKSVAPEPRAPEASPAPPDTGPPEAGPVAVTTPE